MVSVLEVGRSAGGGHSNPCQYSCLENPMDRGAWWATIHRVAQSQAPLKRLSTFAVHIQHQEETLTPRKKCIITGIKVLASSYHEKDFDFSFSDPLTMLGSGFLVFVFIRENLHVGTFPAPVLLGDFQFKAHTYTQKALVFASVLLTFFLRAGEWEDYHSILFKCSQSLIKGRVLESQFISD